MAAGVGWAVPEPVIGFHATARMVERRHRGGLALLPCLLDAAAERGCRVLPITESEGSDPVDHLLDLVRARVVSAVVYMDAQVDDPRGVALMAAGVPHAVMGRAASGGAHGGVDLDNAGAMRLALDHLWSRGHRSIGFVAPQAPGYWWDERVQGFCDWAAAPGRRDARTWFHRAPYDEVRVAVRDRLLAPDPPTAIVAAGDGVAAPCYDGVADAGRQVGSRVGSDVAVVGYDPDLWMLQPPLTTLVPPLGAVARELVDQVLDQLAGGPPRRPGVLVPATLQVAESG